MVKIITASLADSNNASFKAGQRMPLNIAMQNTTKAPSAPPSVGVPMASPKGLYTNKMMIATTATIGSAGGKDLKRSPQV